MSMITCRNISTITDKVNAIPCVDDGIEKAVRVAEPLEGAFEHGVYFHMAALEQRLDEGKDEEGKPAGGETPHDHAEGLGRLALGFERRRRPRT